MEAHVRAQLLSGSPPLLGCPRRARPRARASRRCVRPKRSNCRSSRWRSIWTPGFAAPSADAAHVFPAAARHWGVDRIAALACLTDWLHGVPRSALDLRGIVAEPRSYAGDRDSIHYRVTAIDKRFRVVRLSVAGGGIAGTISSSALHRGQAKIVDLAHEVTPNEFAGIEGLIIGGLRGLGEVTAKLLAAGGARVTITDASAKADAESIKARAAPWVWIAQRPRRYHVRADWPAVPQLAPGLSPTQTIFCNPAGPLSVAGLLPRLFHVFLQFLCGRFLR